MKRSVVDAGVGNVRVPLCCKCRVVGDNPCKVSFCVNPGIGFILTSRDGRAFRGFPCSSVGRGVCPVGFDVVFKLKVDVDPMFFSFSFRCKLRGVSRGVDVSDASVTNVIFSHEGGMLDFSVNFLFWLVTGSFQG